MNKQPIEMANDADLRLSLHAMQRAAKRAQELATRTGTTLIVKHRGKANEVGPKPQDKTVPNETNSSD